MAANNDPMHPGVLDDKNLLETGFSRLEESSDYVAHYGAIIDNSGDLSFSSHSDDSTSYSGSQPSGAHVGTSGLIAYQELEESGESPKKPCDQGTVGCLQASANHFYLLVRRPQGNDNERSRLDKLPSEILAKICGKLDAIWIYNLSNVSSHLRSKLVGPHANRIWYDAMPQALWRKSERFQDEDELLKWGIKACEEAIYSGHCEDDRQPAWAPVAPVVETRGNGELPSYENLNKQEIEPQKSHKTGESEDQENIDLILGAYAAVSKLSIRESKRIRLSPDNGEVEHSSMKSDETRTLTNPSAIDKSISNMIGAHHSEDAHYLFDRKPALALGGPYQPFCDYRRELLGHLKSRSRCYVCLNKKSFFNGKPVDIDRWGLMWCEECFRKYSIPFKSLRNHIEIIKDMHGAEDDFEFILDAPFRTCLYKSSVRCYTPEVSEILRSNGIESLRAIKHRCETSKAWKDRMISRKSPWHCLLRQLIVCTAEQIWEGIDPAPIWIQDESTSVQMFFSRSHVSKARFAQWRTRFAPTEKLRYFLFPKELLNNVEPEMSIVSARAKYLKDPVEDLDIKTARRATGDTAWIERQAHTMLRNLTEFRQPGYNKPGLGGSCTLWNEAARKWHKRRLERKVDAEISEANMRLFEFKSRKMTRTLKNRLRIGEIEVLKDLGTNRRQLRALFRASDLNLPENASTHQRYIQAQSLRAQEIDFDDRLKHGKKILLATCKRCPVNSLVVTKKGINATLNHMRDGHPMDYWLRDDWYLVG